MEEQVKGPDAARRAQEAPRRTPPEMGPKIQDAGQAAADLAGAGTETMVLWANANQRAVREMVELYAGTAKETARLYGEMQRSLVDLLRDTQVAAIRWQTMWPEAFRDPMRWYQKAFEETIETSQKTFRLLGGNAEAVSGSVERMTQSAKEAGKGIQEAFTSAAASMKDLRAA